MNRYPRKMVMEKSLHFKLDFTGFSSRYNNDDLAVSLIGSFWENLLNCPFYGKASSHLSIQLLKGFYNMHFH